MTTSGADRPTYPIASVDNALRLLLLLQRERQVRLTDASQYLGVATSTAHRLLAMLEYRGLVSRDRASKLFGPGPALLSLAASIVGALDALSLVRPVMGQLQSRFDETVHFGLLDGSMVRFIDAVESSQGVRVASRAGKSLPAHCTSAGKALLAALSPEQVRRFYPNSRMAQVTPQSIRYRRDLEAQLVEIRQKGFAVNRGESEDGVGSVSVAIRPAPTLAVGALNISAPLYRLTDAHIDEFAGALSAVARTMPVDHISADLK